MEHSIRDEVPFIDIPQPKVMDFFEQALQYGHQAITPQIRTLISAVVANGLKPNDELTLLLVDLQESIKAEMSKDESKYNFDDNTSVSCLKPLEIDEIKLAYYQREENRINLLVVDDTSSVRKLLPAIVSRANLVRESTTLSDGKDLLSLYKRSCVSFFLDRGIDEREQEALFKALELHSEDDPLKGAAGRPFATYGLEEGIYLCSTILLFF